MSELDLELLLGLPVVTSEGMASIVHVHSLLNYIEKDIRQIP